MRGVTRLSWLFFSFLICSSLVATLAIAGGNPAANASDAASPPPPKPQPVVVEDTLHGHKISDPFRWLENGESPASQQFVHDELSYTRSVLDPLTGRAALHDRL